MILNLLQEAYEEHVRSHDTNEVQPQIMLYNNCYTYVQ